MTNYGDKPLEFSYDEASDIITIEGMKYSGELFRKFSDGLAFRLNTPFIITKRKDGVITVRTLECRVINGDE